MKRLSEKRRSISGLLKISVFIVEML